MVHKMMRHFVLLPLILRCIGVNNFYYNLGRRLGFKWRLHIGNCLYHCRLTGDSGGNSRHCPSSGCYRGNRIAFATVIVSGRVVVDYFPFFLGGRGRAEPLGIRGIILFFRVVCALGELIFSLNFYWWILVRLAS